jgi:N-hydroxyarylamine O-acetyltransferase
MDSAAPLDLAAYLDRIGFAGETRPDLATLRALHEAHATHIPFENLDIHMGRSIRLDLESVQAKLVRHRRGGYCFEQNALLAAALERVGFSVTRLSGRVRLGIPTVRPRTHMLLKVEADGRSWICDVGFGSWGLLQPIVLATNVENRQGAWTYSLRREDELTWVLQCPECPTGPDLYAFDLTPHLPVDYEPANFFTSTHPESRFVLSLTAQRIERDVRHALRDRELVTVSAAGTHAEVIGTNVQLLELLAVRFGIHLPAGTRFPQYE